MNDANQQAVIQTAQEQFLLIAKQLAQIDRALYERASGFPPQHLDDFKSSFSGIEYTLCLDHVRKSCVVMKSAGIGAIKLADIPDFISKGTDGCDKTIRSMLFNAARNIAAFHQAIDLKIADLKTSLENALESSTAALKLIAADQPSDKVAESKPDNPAQDPWLASTWENFTFADGVRLTDLVDQILRKAGYGGNPGVRFATYTILKAHLTLESATAVTATTKITTKYQHDEINDFVENEINKLYFLDRDYAKVIERILLILDKHGDCPSVVHDTGEPDALLDASTYVKLSQTPLYRHALNTARADCHLSSLSAEHFAASLTAALAHDIGKCACYRNKDDDLQDHALISSTVLEKIPGFEKLAKKNDIAEAIKRHHKPFTESATFGKLFWLKLTAADREARRHELNGTQPGPVKNSDDGYWALENSAASTSVEFCKKVYQLLGRRTRVNELLYSLESHTIGVNLASDLNFLLDTPPTLWADMIHVTAVAAAIAGATPELKLQ